MRRHVLTSISLILITVTGFLIADVLFGITTPLGHPGFLLTSAVLATIVWQAGKTQEKRLQQAVDRYVHKESMREMEIERRREREKASASDSRPSHIIAP